MRQKSLMKDTERGEAGVSAARKAGQKEYLDQAIRQATHSLTRFFREIDANYKQFKTASRQRAAAALRLESQRAYYDEGRISVDRFLDAVSQYATAVGAEAQYKSTYNIMIVALEESKGTLLDYLQIAIAEGPKPAKVGLPGEVTRAAVEPLMVPPPAQPGPALLPDMQPGAPTPTPAQEAGPTAGVAGKTVSFHFTIGNGPKPLEIRGSFTITPAAPADRPQRRPCHPGNFRSRAMQLPAVYHVRTCLHRRIHR